MAPENPIAPAGAQRATAREFLAVLFRRRWIIIGLFSVVLAVVLFTTLGTARYYYSAGQVLVKRGEQESTMQPYRQVPNEWEIELGSEVQTAKSWPVIQLAQKFLDAEHRAGPRLKLDAGEVDVEVTGKTNVLAIAYTDRDPRVAERACDAMLRAYIEYRQNSMLSYPEHFFSGEIRQATDELARWSAKRKEFSAQTGVVDLPTQRGSLIALRAGLEQRRSGVTGDLAEAQSAFREMGILRQNPMVDMPSLVQSNDNAIETVKTRVIEQESRIARLRERFRDDAPEVLSAQATLDTLRHMLQREVDSRYEISRGHVEVQRASVSAVERDLAEVDARLSRMGQLEGQAAEIESQINTWQDRYKDLAKSSDQARVNQNTVPRLAVFLLNPASPAQLRNTQDYVRLALAPAFSLLVGVGLAFFVDGLDLTVHTAGQAEEEVHLPVLAAITERRRGSWRPGALPPEKIPS